MNGVRHLLARRNTLDHQGPWSIGVFFPLNYNFLIPGFVLIAILNYYTPIQIKPGKAVSEVEIRAIIQELSKTKFGGNFKTWLTINEGW